MKFLNHALASVPRRVLVLLAAFPFFSCSSAALVAQDAASAVSADADPLVAGNEQSIEPTDAQTDETPSAGEVGQSLQSLETFYESANLQWLQVKDKIAKFDVSLANINQVFAEVLFYDFGTSKLAAFAPKRISLQAAKEYLNECDQADCFDVDKFEVQLRSALTDYRLSNNKSAANLSEATSALTVAGLQLPPAPRGMVYVFDANEQSLLLEPPAIGIPFIVAWLVIGSVLLTLRMKLINLRGILHAVALAFGKYANSQYFGELSHVRALYTSLSSSAGLGAISSTAIAVGIAGPGAAFWIMICSFLAMATKFTECSLSQSYRCFNSEGSVLGGPMRYMHQGFTHKRIFGCSLIPLGQVLGFCFALLCVCVALIFGSAFQVSQALAGLQTVGGLERLVSEPWIFGAVMAALVSLVVFGSVRWLGRVAVLLTPFAILTFAAACLMIIGANWADAEVAFRAIFAEAFEPQAAVAGGLFGVMLVGLSQAPLAADAGLGTTAIVHAAAQCDEPTREGVIAMLEPLIVGVVLGLLTAMTLGVSGVANGTEGQILVAGGKGTALLLSAVPSNAPEWVAYMLHAAFALFAFSACIAWGYFGERCIVHLLGSMASIPFKLVFVLFTFLGSVLTVNNLMTFSQLLLLTLAIPNMIALVLLHGIVVEELDDYWKRLRAGKFKSKRTRVTPAPSE